MGMTAGGDCKYGGSARGLRAWMSSQLTVGGHCRGSTMPLYNTSPPYGFSAAAALAATARTARNCFTENNGSHSCGVTQAEISRRIIADGTRTGPECDY